MQTNNLIGHGPSKARIVDKGDYKVVIKDFPNTEQDRVIKETKKMQTLYSLSQETDLFKVPKILDIKDFNYTMEYIPNCKELNDVYNEQNSFLICDKIINIINFLKNKKCEDNSISVWNAMIKKFKALKTENKDYNTLIDYISKKTISIPSGYSHGDFTFDNTLVNNNLDFYLIDPAWSEAESPLWDVGKVLQSTAINWNYIKEHNCNGKRGTTLITINNILLNGFIKTYEKEHILLATACQLSRVARWCFPEILIPIIIKLLTVYKENNENEFINTLRWFI